MSIHSSLRAGSTMTGHRNVLKRVERLERLEAREAWAADKDSVLGLPKVRSIKPALKKKKKKKDEEEEK